MNKALVTQSSAAIPVVPLYISILYKVMKEHGNHEGCIEQMRRLWGKLFGGELGLDSEGQIRMDDWEMLPEIQDEVKRLWDNLTQENFKEYTDLDGYWHDFYALFGFGFDGVNYDADVQV